MSSVLVTSVLSSENLQTGKIETSTDCFKSFFFSLTNVDERRTHIWHSNRKRLGRDHSNKTRYSPQAGFLLGLSSQSFIFLISSGSRPSFRLIGFHSVLREYRHTARNLQTRAKITLPVYLCDRNDGGRTCN